MFCPMTKNDAGTLCSSRISRTSGVVSLLGPSSKLKATSIGAVVSVSEDWFSDLDDVRGAHDSMMTEAVKRTNLIIVFEITWLSEANLLKFYACEM